MALVFLFAVVDLVCQGICIVAGASDGGVARQSVDNLILKSLEEALDALVGILQKLGVQILGEIVGGGAQLVDVHLATGGNLRLGQAFFDCVALGNLIGIVVLTPLGSLSFAANAVHGPAIGDVIRNLLIGIAHHAGADAAETVAAEVAGVGHLLDDIVFQGEGVLLYRADVLLIQSLSSLGLVLIKADHGGILGVLTVHQEAEIEG